ncbi:MAG: threonine--tRNA ligase [Flavobacteriales bacterium]|nr:threonine--tRNA ligase [Flavobacteriales bacterium]
MSLIKITLPDGAIKEVEKGSSAMDIAKSISEGLARNVLAAKVNDEVTDSDLPINENATLQLLTWRDEEGKSTFWHSSAHLMAEAIQFFFPNAKFTIGPPIETGFYYDVDFGEESISETDLGKIEKKMLELASQKNGYDRKVVSKNDAIEFYSKRENPYKIELIDDLEDGSITFYTQGEFTDLCRGPHIPHTGLIKAVKLTNIAGAYWRGDEKNKQITRVYGASFPKKSELNEYLERLEQAKKRDHRKLGKELGLFTFSEKVGQGLPLWLPKGTALRERLTDFLKKAQDNMGYQQVITPHIGNKKLYITSGHYEKYGEDSFQPIKTPVDDEEFFLKPMNCPHHCEIFKATPHSYRDLPVRLAEFGTVYRYEQSGELHGLTRVRGFTQDDAHIFCTREQVKEEFKLVIDLVMLVLEALDFQEYTAQISLRDKEDRSKYIGSDENWEMAERAIIEAAQEKGLETTVEHGEAAFYGPKLDFMIKDAIGRKWQLGTIQVDYNLPERFELEYKGSDNEMHRPVMIHRAPFGSMERFVAVLTEHCAGEYPLWLNPEQVTILTISEKFNEHARALSHELNNYDIRASVDERNEKVGKKIREAELRKVPYMLIIGEKEAENGTVSVRKHKEGDKGTLSAEDFRSLVHKEVKSKLDSFLN